MSFAPAADICFSTSHQIVYKRLGILSPALTSRLRSPPACTCLLPALTSCLHSAPAWTRLPPGLTSRLDSPHYTCAWICVHLRTHLAASQKHNKQLGATSPLPPPRVACGTLSGAVLPTPMRVCGGDTHLSGASQLTCMPSRLSGATHLAALHRVFLVTPTGC